MMGTGDDNDDDEDNDADGAMTTTMTTTIATARWATGYEDDGDDDDGGGRRQWRRTTMVVRQRLMSIWRATTERKSQRATWRAVGLHVGLMGDIIPR
jgi:hypothetical protein